MNWLDTLVIIVAIYSIFKGYKTGLIKQLASLAAIIACVLLSGKISSIILPYLRSLGKIPENLVESAAFIASFLLIFAAFMLLGYMLQSILQTVKLGTLNKLAGAALCITKWMIVVSLMLNLLIKMDSNHLIIPADIDTRSKSYPYIQPIAAAITPYLKFNIA